MSHFQIFAALFALFMLYTVRIYANKKTIQATESGFWYSIWALFIIVAIFPGLLTGLASTFHFSRVFDLLVVIAFMLISIVTFNNYFYQKKVEQKLEQLVRSTALAKKK